MSFTAVPTSGSLSAAAQWLDSFAQGPLATTLAVLAIAGAGIAMMTGRLALRRGAGVVLGCFLLFGAPAIARGLMSSALELAPTELPTPNVDRAPPPPSQVPQHSNPPIRHDPYAGASLAG